jgi:galactokinase
MTIDRDTWVAARPRTDFALRVASLNLDAEELVDLDALQRNEERLWVNYVAGMAWALKEAGYEVGGADMLVHTTVPVSSGLSSSAALEMAVAVAFESLAGYSLDSVVRAQLGQRAENQFVGVNCGILDQYTSSVGRAGSAVLLDCRELSSRSVPIPPAIGVVICDTRASRSLASSQYGERRAQCEEAVRTLSEHIPNVTALRDVSSADFYPLEHLLPEDVARRARFIVEEDERVLALARALEGDDRTAVASTTQASFLGARDLYQITVPEMEAMYSAMSTGHGVIGARQAGAGFGGCMVAFVVNEETTAFAEHVKEAYEADTGIAPIVYLVEPGPGAGQMA